MTVQGSSTSARTESPAESVKNAISNSTCSAGTVTLFSTLLGRETSNTTETKKPSRSASTHQSSRAKKLASTTSKTSSSLSKQEAFALATEIVNLGLKTLGTAGNALAEASDSKSNSAGKRPVNTKGGKSSVQDATTKNSTAFAAECCKIALEHLRAEEAARSLPALQVDRAQNSFITKLLQLKMYEMALSESRILKQRLDEFMLAAKDSTAWMPEEGKGSGSKSSQKSKAKSGSGLSSLLKFEGFQPASTAAAFAVGCQMNCLRSISGLQQPALIEELAEILRYPSVLLPYSCDDKQIRMHLPSLSSILLSLCPSTASAADQLASNSGISPSSALQLQALALECKTVSVSSADDMTRLWQSLEKCMNAFLRRDRKLSAQLRYSNCLHAYERLVKANNADSEPSTSILNLLSSLAQQAGLQEEALRFLGSSKKGAQDECSRISQKAKIAAVYIKGINYSDEKSLGQCAESIESVMKALDGVKKGRKDSLEALLVEISNLRRILSNAYAQAEDRQHECFRSFSAFPISAIRFYARYLALIPDGVASVRKSALGAVDSIGSYIRRLDCSDWEEVDSVLQDSVELVRSLENAETGDIIESYSPQYERISDWYWKLGTIYRKEGLSAQAVVAFARSILVQEKCNREDILKSHYCARLEKIGNIWLERGDLGRAEQSYADAVEKAHKIGLLSSMGRYSAMMPLERIFTGDNFAHIGRCIVGYMKIRAKKCTTARDLLPASITDTLEDNATLGVLLEWELRASAELGENAIKNVARSLSGTLLDIYTDDVPIRRARVISKILEISLNSPHIWEPTELFELASSISTPKVFRDDAEIKYFFPDTLAQCMMYAFMVSYSVDNLQLELLEAALSTWNTLLQKLDTWEKASKYFASPDLLQSRLNLLYEFLCMKGLDSQCVTALKLSIRTEELKNLPSKNNLVHLLILLAQLQLRLGNIREADAALQTAKPHLSLPDTFIEIRAEWFTTRSAYYIAVRDIEKAIYSFEQARQIMGPDPRNSVQTEFKSPLHKRLALNQIIGDASSLAARILYEQGLVNEALSLSRKAIRFIQRNWAGLEAVKKSGAQDAVVAQTSMVGSWSQSPTRRLAPPPQPIAYSTTYAAFKSPLLWKIVPQFHSALSFAAMLARHQGMVREAEYYLEQAISVVKATNSSALLANSYISLGDLKVRSGAVDDGEKFLVDAGDLLKDWNEAPDSIQLHLAFANLQREKKFFKEELVSYTMTEDLIRRLYQREGVAEAELTEKLSSLEISGSKGKTASSRKALPAPKTPKKSGSRTPKRTPKKEPAKAKASQIRDVPNDLYTTQLWHMILTLKADAYAVQGQFQEMNSTLSSMQDVPSGKHEALSKTFLRAKGHFLEGVSLLAADPSMSVIQDSILSLPHVIETPTAESGDRKGKKTVSKKGDFLAPFARALEEASALQSFALKSGCTALCQKISTFIGGLVVLIAALGNGPGHADYASYSLEVSKGIALVRERQALLSEKEDAVAELKLEWPQISPFSAPEFTEVDRAHLLNAFRREYIDIIPPTWAAVSLSLSENKEELYLCRYEAGREPFTVRLPLTRHASNDGDEDDEEEPQEEAFEYSDIVREFEDIMSTAHNNTHSAKDITQGKSPELIEQWWSERRALDTRLATLLDNIERYWLGGFKGLVRQNFIDSESLSMFQASFERILNKYLPSRQRKTAGRRGAGAAKANVRATIDPRIYELFIGLGDPTAEDLEGSLLDLINFVIDILQFHGEENAYDEIEMDEILVETTDALRAYYERVADHNENEKCETTHTILILDKALQMLPWECLPCLSGQPISRLPSISYLKTILENPKMCHSGSTPGIYLDKTNGSYVLNPAMDLVSTQKTFEPDFERLKGWSGISGRPPTENEFRDELASRDIFLYLGHGSGHQYIRSRTVKKLDQCAVSVLLGCSSGKLHGGGEYELYGVPWNYLLGGCPAVLCCLWDVTDKDLDRFGKSVFNDWGLIPAKEDGRESGGLSLVEAVAKARDSCKLKYLNGAAMVVYGVPAYI